MFGLFAKKASQSENGLFLVPVKVGRGNNTEVPAALAGAIVPAFVAAPGHEAAAKAAVGRLTAQGFEFLDISGAIQQLDPSNWDQYVDETWAEFRTHLPSQDVLRAGLSQGAIFFGPFAGYEA